MGGGGKFILKKFNAIMIPYLLWSLVVRPLFFNTYHTNLQYDKILMGTLVDNTSYWFLPSLFGLLVCYAVYKMVRERFAVNKIGWELSIVIGIFAVVALLFKISHIDLFRSIMSYYIPFWIGIFMGQYHRLNSLMTNNSTLFGICLIAFCLIEGLFVGRMDIALGKAVRLTTGLLALPILFYLFSNISMPATINKVFSTIGRETLGIYVMHFTLLSNLAIISCNSLAIQIPVFALISMVIIGICLIAIKILGVNKTIKKCLFGTI